MNLEKYTERARGFIQSAQSLALRENHQQFTPEHVLKVLLDDEQGLCAGLIDQAGGQVLASAVLALAGLAWTTCQKLAANYALQAAAKAMPPGISPVTKAP